MMTQHSSMSYSHGYCNTPAGAGTSVSFFARVDTAVLAVSILLCALLRVLILGF